ncbi:MAG: glutathione S-transferase family protein [Cyanobacteriota bacterium]|nr:glutathione S-transferase family protein [Cyanobacteriota bacterium]
MTAAPLSWEDLQAHAAPEPDRVNGPTNAQACLRLFGGAESEVRVTLFRDHHAWCPYCQKVWLWLEERRIPYRIRKVTMFCYGEKERWYRQLVPSGMLPALQLDDRLITESDRILEALEAAFGSRGPALYDPEVLALRQLERQLFRAWCQWLCHQHSPASDSSARDVFRRLAHSLEQALEAREGAFLMGADLCSADLVFVPYLERMNASLTYYKGYGLRWEHPAIHRWFCALELRTPYLGTQSDFHTHAHDLPPQMGGCFASGERAQQLLAARIDHGPWPIEGPGLFDPETSQPEPVDAKSVALNRVLRHRGPLVERNPLPPEAFDPALRSALSRLVSGESVAPPPGSAAGLRHLRDRISVPRDMPLAAARRLRQALESTARLDPAAPEASGEPIPALHRRDQDPRPFLR